MLKLYVFGIIIIVVIISGYVESSSAETARDISPHFGTQVEGIQRAKPNQPRRGGALFRASTLSLFSRR